MLKSSLITLLLGLSLYCLPFPSLSQDLVYRPINPAFGGDTFNYQWLLSSASEQNRYKDKEDERDPLDELRENLNRQILNQLARELTDNIFGEDGLQEGVFDIEGFQITITEGADGLNVDILDVNNGGSTTIVIPYY